VSPKAFYKTLDENGKTGLYLVEPHHQRLKRIAEFIFMSPKLGTESYVGKGSPSKNRKKVKAFGDSESLPLNT
jgi:hypothetical protein